MFSSIRQSLDLKNVPIVKSRFSVLCDPTSEPHENPTTKLSSSHRPRQKTHSPLPLLLNTKDNEDGAHKRIRSSLPGEPFAWYVSQPIDACCRFGNENAVRDPDYL